MKKHWLILHVSILLTCSCVLADTHYVVKDNPGASSPYLTWATAAANIQDAIDVTGVGDTVLVSNGFYDTGTRYWAAGSGQTNRVVITNSVILVAASTNPADTVIVGAPDPDTTNGPLAVRGVYLGAGSVLDGFMVSNCYCKSWNSASRGAGVYVEDGGIVRNCVITSNLCYYGSAIYAVGNAIISNCTLSFNFSFYGSGGYGGIYYNCNIISNSTDWEGAGLFLPVYVQDCLIQGNRGRYGSGGYRGLYNRCRFIANNNYQSTGGAVDGDYTGANYAYITNCLVMSNIGGAGCANVQAWNCTIVSNINYGVRNTGAAISSFTNCIIYGNSPADFRAGTYSMSYSCAVTNIGTFQGGTAVVTNDPMFVDEANGNYRLKKAGSNPNGWSPCIDSGLNEAWMIGATDLDGNPRILPVGGTVDMGCFEYVPPPTGTMFVGW